MKSIRFVSAVSLCFFLSTLSHAAPKENWLVAKASGGALAYNAGFARNNETGNLTLATGLYLKQAQKSESGKPFQYVLAEDRLTCTDGTFQVVTRVLLDGNQNIVDQWELDPDLWQPISGNGVLAFFESVVCKGDKVGGASKAASIEDMLNVMKKMAK